MEHLGRDDGAVTMENELSAHTPRRLPQARGHRGAGLRPRSVLPLVVLLVGCVSQTRYQEALDMALLNERAYHDANQYKAELEAKVDRLEAEVALRNRPVEAGFEPYDARIEELRSLVSDLGASDDVTPVAVEGGFGYSLKDSVLFDSGSAEIREDGALVLDRLAEQIAASSYRRVWVRGHTDSDPVVRPATRERFPNGNLELSAARAIQVAAHLMGDGRLDADRLAVAGFGPSDPIAANDSPTNKQRNRRVEIFVLEAASEGTD